MPEFDRPPLSNYGVQEIHLLKTGGASEDDILAAQSRYRVTSAEYTRFSKAMNLPQQRERVTVDGLGTIGQMKQASVDKSVENDIIGQKQAEIRADILNGKYNLSINIGNQNKHIPSSHSYKEELHKSIFFSDLKEAQALVDKYHGTGDIRLTQKGEWTKKEFADAKHDIGAVYDRKTLTYINTSRFAIHYGNKGTHIVPSKKTNY